MTQTDLELTRLCAEAMGYIPWPQWDSAGFLAYRPANFEPLDTEHFFYDPLHDDAQAMALMKRFGLWVSQVGGIWSCVEPTGFHQEEGQDCKNEILNRAIVECVAKMQAASLERPQDEAMSK